MMKGYEDDEDMDYTVLTEFSSVVADTQQYIVPGQAEEGDSKEGEVTQTDEDSQQVMLQQIVNKATAFLSLQLLWIINLLADYGLDLCWFLFF